MASMRVEFSRMPCNARPKGELVITAPVVFGRLHVVPVITAFLAASIVALNDTALSKRLVAWRARQTDAVAEDPTL